MYCVHYNPIEKTCHPFPIEHQHSECRFTLIEQPVDINAAVVARPLPQFYSLRTACIKRESSFDDSASQEALLKVMYSSWTVLSFGNVKS